MIGGLIASIHLYFLPMCGMFLAGYIFCSFIKEKRVEIKYALPGVAFCGCLFGVTYLLGGFSSHANLSDAGLGDCSFNLNGFINSNFVCADFQYFTLDFFSVALHYNILRDCRYD